MLRQAKALKAQFIRNAMVVVVLLGCVVLPERGWAMEGGNDLTPRAPELLPNALSFHTVRSPASSTHKILIFSVCFSLLQFVGFWLFPG